MLVPVKWSPLGKDGAKDAEWVVGGLPLPGALFGAATRPGLTCDSYDADPIEIQLPPFAL
jgi:hypothetical protein